MRWRRSTGGHEPAVASLAGGPFASASVRVSQITILCPEFRCRYEGDYRNRCNREDRHPDNQTFHDSAPVAQTTSVGDSTILRESLSSYRRLAPDASRA